MATIVGLSLPVIIGFGVLAVDVGHFYSVRTKLQQAADISSLSILASLRDNTQIDFLTVAWARDNKRQVAVELAKKNLPASAKSTAVGEHDVVFGKWDFNRKRFLLSGDQFPANAVRVQAQMNRWRANPVKTIFGKMFKEHVDVNVTSIAVMPVPPSFHMLSPDASGALEMHGNADIDVWGLQVNSTANDAFVWTARAGGIGSPRVAVGGGATGIVHRNVETDVAPVRDYLSDLPTPDVKETCDFNNYVTNEPRPTLVPGVYCGGLTITGALEVTFEDGDEPFVIKGGPLVIDANMDDREITGENVLIYLADEKAELQIHGGDLFLRAKEAGPWAGVVIMAARGEDAPETLLIDNATTFFSGIFYAPDSAVESESTDLNGTCVYVCFVSSKLKLTSTQVNYGYFMQNTSLNPFRSISGRPAEPAALKRRFRPYLLNEAKFSIF